jgi:hypothetical protein
VHQILDFTQEWPTPTLRNYWTGGTPGPTPGSSVMPWTNRIPLSADILVRRTTGTGSITSLTPTPTTIPGPDPAQLVLSSTKLSSLFPGICGFVPYWNGTATTLGKLGVGHLSTVRIFQTL